MTNKLFLLFFLLCALFKHQAVQSYEFTSENMPHHMLIKEEIFSWTTTFNIESEDRKLGSVHRKLLSWTPEYDFVNNAGEHIAKGRMRFFSWTVVFDVTDAIGAQLGKVQEMPFTFFPSFEIVSPNGTILAVAKLNFWRTKYIIKTYDGKHFATMWRSFFRWKDDWRLDIHDHHIFREKEVDPRMFILLAIFQTDREYWRSIKNQENLAIPYLNKSFDKTKLLGLLEPYRADLHGIQPTDQECEGLEQIVEDALACLDEPSEEPNALPANDEEAVVALIELLDSDSLTPGQKSALFLLLQQKIREG